MSTLAGDMCGILPRFSLRDRMRLFTTVVWQALLVGGVMLSEMPFLDHLEELWRGILKSLIGMAVGMAICLVSPVERVGLAQPTGQAQAATGFHVSGRHLLDANGNNFVMRGINHPHTWYPTQTSSFANMKAAGANTVRVVLASGQRWPPNSASDVANVIQLCKSNRLICVLEVHDTTGFGEQNGAATLSQAVSYWQQIQSVLAGQEAYVIINIGNEPYGNNFTVNANWVNDTSSAISQMRSAGFRHTLMVDAPNWGQDWQFIMRDNASRIFNSDPDRNTVFSVHMYGVFDTASKVQNYISTFVNIRLPLVIGEFGHLSPDGNPDEDAIMAQAQVHGIGYLAWSWSGNGGGVEYLDMVTNFDPDHITSWGNRVINGAKGLKQTSQEASVYGAVCAIQLKLTLSVNQPSFRPGATLRIGLKARNVGPAFNADFYFGVVLPDGVTVCFLTSLSPPACAIRRLDGDPRTFPPLLPNVIVPQGLDAMFNDLLVFPFQGGEPPGTYVSFAALTPPGVLGDGRIDVCDIIEITTQAFSFGP